MIAGSLALMSIGALAVLVAVAGAYRVGRFVTNLEGLQMRVTLRELGALRKADKRQIKAIDDAIGRLITDPRTHAHTVLDLEKLRELTAPRDV